MQFLYGKPRLIQDRGSKKQSETDRLIALKRINLSFFAINFLNQLKQWQNNNNNEIAFDVTYAAVAVVINCKKKLKTENWISEIDSIEYWIEYVVRFVNRKDI